MDGDAEDGEVFLVTHRGAVFLRACLTRPHPGVAWARVTLGLWRLARKRLEWEPVAYLHLRTVESLTGSTDLHDLDVVICGAFGAQEFLCCNEQVHPKTATQGTPLSTFLLGFNLDTGEWELLHHNLTRGAYWNRDSDSIATPMELSPHLFLSQTHSCSLTDY